jgi:hypothetical protein
MNELEAKRIAAVVGIIRPDWREGLVMTVLADERLRHRVYEDVLVAAVACYSDTTTGRPGRIHEPGRWWMTVTATTPAPQHREIRPDDCGICSRPAGLHSPLSADPHEWEPRDARGRGEKPAPELRAAIDQANEAALLKVTAAKEAQKAREVAGVDEVLARHQSSKDDDESTTSEEKAS